MSKECIQISGFDGFKALLIQFKEPGLTPKIIELNIPEYVIMSYIPDSTKEELERVNYIKLPSSITNSIKRDYPEEFV